MNDGKTTYSQTGAEAAAEQTNAETAAGRMSGEGGQPARLFTILDQQIPIQEYEGGRYEVKVFGNFTRLKNQDGTSSVLEDSRLLMKRGEFIPVSAEMDYLNGRVDQVLVDAINGGSGSARYLSVLEKDQRIEDYYEQIRWPEELSNAGIREISSTLDTNDTVLMVRYTDNTVAAFNYVTGSLLFKDETEKETLSFKDYIGNWFTETWSNLWGPDTVKYDEIKVMEQELKKKPLDALLKGTEAGNGENFSSGDNVMGNVNAHGSGGTGAGADQMMTGTAGTENYRRPGEAGKYGAAGGQNPAAAGTVSGTVPGGTVGTISGESGGRGAESSQGAGAGQSTAGSQSAVGAGQGTGSAGEGAGSSLGAGTSSAAGTAGRDGDEVAGDAGVSGADGATGVSASGADGVTGAGASGVSGADGVTGAGASGVSGADGVTGAGAFGVSGAEGVTGDGASGDTGASGETGGGASGADGFSGAGDDADGEQSEASDSRGAEDGSEADRESAGDESSDGELSEDGQSEEDGASGDEEGAETAGKTGAKSGDGREGESSQEDGEGDGEESSQSAAAAPGGDFGGDTGVGGAGTESATGAGAPGMSAGKDAGVGGTEYAQAAGTGKGSIPQVSLTPYVPVYDPETGTYQLYDTKEYFNQNYTAEPLMSVTQKLENVGITGTGSSRGLFGNQTGVAGYVVTVTGALLAALLLLRCAVNRIVKR